MIPTSDIIAVFYRHRDDLVRFAARRAQRYRPLLEYADRLRIAEALPGPEETVDKLQFLERLQSEVNRLPAQRRMAFTLVEIQNYSVRDAAIEMGVSEMNVYQLIKRAYALLAQRMVTQIPDNANGV